MLNTNYSYVFKECISWLSVGGAADKTIENHKGGIKEFLEWLQCKNIKHVKRITQKNVLDYFEYLETRPNKRREGGLGVSHLNNNFIAVDKLLTFLNKMDISMKVYPTQYRIKVDKQEGYNNIKPFTYKEITILKDNIELAYKHLPIKDREEKVAEINLLFALYYGCGLRRAEGWKLTIDSIDFSKRTVFVNGKKNKDRIVPMSEGVYKVVEDYIFNFRNLIKLGHNRLFIHAHGTLNRYLKHVHSVTDETNIQSKPITLHKLRHSIATTLLTEGMAIEQISKFLSHESLDSTQIYTHLD